MTPLQRRIMSLLEADVMTLQDVIDAFTPLGIKASDVRRACEGLYNKHAIFSAQAGLIGKPAEVTLMLASTI
jgi:hypothetical protein